MTSTTMKNISEKHSNNKKVPIYQISEKLIYHVNSKKAELIEEDLHYIFGTNAKYALSVFDVDGDGILSVDDLTNFLENLSKQRNKLKHWMKNRRLYDAFDF